MRRVSAFAATALLFSCLSGTAHSEPSPPELRAAKFICQVNEYPPTLDAEGRIYGYADHTCDSRPDWAPKWLEIRLLSRACERCADREVTVWRRSDRKEDNWRVSRTSFATPCKRSSAARWYVTEARAYVQNGVFQGGGKSSPAKLGCSN